jgi:hypothetical protein
LNFVDYTVLYFYVLPIPEFETSVSISVAVNIYIHRINLMHSRKIVSFSRNAISSIRSPACKTVMTYPTFVPTRFISETSFAKDMLKKQGEKLEPAPQYEEGDYKFVVDQTVYQPTEKVLRVVDSVLELDVVEIQMFVLQIQVQIK